MYKLLLCWRYLLTRYLALACIISVMLGVGTLIVVNSVMSGFSTKLRDRLHGLLSDVVIEAQSLEGFDGAEGMMDRIRTDPVLKDHVVAMTATMEVPAMIQVRFGRETMTRPIKVIGVDPEGRTKIGGFREYLVKYNEQSKQGTPSFELSDKARAEYLRHNPFAAPLGLQAPAKPGEPPVPAPPPSQARVPHGAILGNLIASYRDESGKDKYAIHPGDEVIITTVGITGGKMTPVYDSFVVVDYFKSEMSEYDNNYVFVPLQHLQHLRTAQDRVTSIQIKLRDYGQVKTVTDRLKTLFPRTHTFQVSTWEEKQGPLLAAIDIERGLLNILLFLIICVAGFGILAIFSMIVMEKTRDIGILKALGASNGGVMLIFLGYGLLLGLVGAGLGVMLGLAISSNINEIEQWVAERSGHTIFDRKVYYFNEIPVNIQPWAVVLVAAGAVGIAVLFSVLPALRAALLHPVRALRYE